MSKVEDKLRELGIALPQPAAPVANYVGFVRSGSAVTVSGQLPFDPEGKLAPSLVGRVGSEIAPEVAKDGVRLCAINVLAQLKAAVGDLDRVRRVVRLGGFIASTPEFTGHGGVMNGASDLMVEVFGDAGRHARSTIGVAGLPMGACVEVEGLFEVE